ncbi:MAG: hypothetical protein L6R39_004347 [Caloplaca ligustica]|nr:MAG: hypothetical protein L6R39_004347 [Caloplaca ligustica]
MSLTRIRGRTPIQYEGELERSIDDPELVARLEELSRISCARREERIHAAVIEAISLYQPPPDILTLDREESPPVGGLPSPAPSPRNNYLLPCNAHVSPPAASSLTDVSPASPVTKHRDPGSVTTPDFSAPDVPAQDALQPQSFLDGTDHDDLHEPFHTPGRRDDSARLSRHGTPVIPTKYSLRGVPTGPTSDRSDSITKAPTLRSRQRPQRSVMTTRSRASPRTVFWELGKAIQYGQRATMKPVPARRSVNSAQGRQAKPVF